MEEKFIILKEARGCLLDPTVKFTESMIQKMQDVYMGNLFRICDALKVVKITPNSVGVNDRWTHNPYINYDDNDMFYKLGKNCMKNGMHWLFIIKDDKMFEGVHRILSFRELVAKNEYKEEEMNFPALDISSAKFNKPVKIEFFKFRGRFNKIHIFGMSTRHLWYKEYEGAKANFFAVSSILKYVYYHWEKKYGSGFKQPSCLMDYDEFITEMEKFVKDE